MTRALVLAAALSACASGYSLATHRTPPLALYAADMLAFSAGCILGINEFNARPEQRNSTVMWSAFGVALLAWGPYWIVATQ